MDSLIEEFDVKKYYEKVIVNSVIREGMFEDVALDSHFKSLPINCDEETVAIDVGYGVGNYTIYLASKGVNVIAIDIIDKKILKKKIEMYDFKHNISIVEADARNVIYDFPVDIVVAKNILHFFSREEICNIIKKWIKCTNYGGVHYIVIFTDIVRLNRNREIVKLKKEADFSINEFETFVSNLYVGWKCDFIVEQYSEKDESGEFDYFKATKVSVVAKNVQELSS